MIGASGSRVARIQVLATNPALAIHDWATVREGALRASRTAPLECHITANCIAVWVNWRVIGRHLALAYALVAFLSTFRALTFVALSVTFW